MGQARLSGRNYVSILLTEDMRDDGTYSVRDCGKVKVRHWSNCEHGLTICTACAYSWNNDHLIRFWATAAGRQLAADIADPRNPIMLRNSSPAWAYRVSNGIILLARNPY